MSSRIIFLLLLCMLAAFYIKSNTLLMLLGAALFVLIISDMVTRKPAKKSGGAPKGEQEIIYPVIYEDTGESPYLFPKKFEVKGYPEEKGGSSPQWTGGISALGKLIGTAIGTIKPVKKDDSKDKKDGKGK